MPSAVMSVTPALLPNATSQTSLNGTKGVCSPELDSNRTVNISPDSPDSVERNIPAPNSPNEEANSDGSFVGAINSMDAKVHHYSGLQEGQSSPMRSPTINDSKSEPGLSPSFTSADSGISTSPVLGGRDERKVVSNLSSIPRNGNEGTSATSGENHYTNSDERLDGDARNPNVGGRNLNLISCEDCGLICAGQSHYQVHIRSHTGERPFKCTVCGVAFTQKGNLRRHYKIHSDEKPFQCPVCSYRCRRRDALNGHMRIHSDVRPYRCVYCARSYKSRQSLKEHEFQCPYKKDPVLTTSKESPSRKNPLEQQSQSAHSDSAHSPLLRNDDGSRNNAMTDPMPPGANPGLIRLDPSKYNYLRSVAGNFKNPSTMASIFAQALAANSASTSGKRKSANPQKITRYQDFPSTHPLMQLPGPLLPPNSFSLHDKERPTTSPSPLPIPAISLPFIPPSMLSSVFQQHQLRQAAVNASLKMPLQEEALDFSARASSGRTIDSAKSTERMDFKKSFHLQRDEKTDNKEDSIRHFSNTGKLFGSAKRKRPRYLNERFVDSEYLGNGGKRSRDTSPDVEYQADTSTAKESSRGVESSGLDLSKFSTNSQKILQIPSPSRSPEDASFEGLRVFRVTEEEDNTDESLLRNAEELKAYFCKHCRCLFLDDVMYAIHAGCHGFQDPFECNVCGFRASDRFQFQSHMTRSEHFNRNAFNESKSPTSHQWDSPTSSSAREYIECLIASGKEDILRRTLNESLPAKAMKTDDWSKKDRENDVIISGNDA